MAVNLTNPAGAASAYAQAAGLAGKRSHGRQIKHFCAFPVLGTKFVQIHKHY